MGNLLARELALGLATLLAQRLGDCGVRAATFVAQLLLRGRHILRLGSEDPSLVLFEFVLEINDSLLQGSDVGGGVLGSLSPGAFMVGREWLHPDF